MLTDAADAAPSAKGDWAGNGSNDEHVHDGHDNTMTIAALALKELQQLYRETVFISKYS